MPFFPTRYYRIAVQWMVFSLWVTLILSTHYPMDNWIAKHIPVSLLLRIDPLAMTVVSGGLRVGVTILLLGFVTLGVSLLLGRVFCGWICPLGAIFDFYGWFLRKMRVKFEGPSPSWYRLKFYLLLALLVFAIIGGVSPLMGFDPIVLLTRTAAAVLTPLQRHNDNLTWVVGGIPGTNGTLNRYADAASFPGDHDGHHEAFAHLVPHDLSARRLSRRFFSPRGPSPPDRRLRSLQHLLGSLPDRRNRFQERRDL